MMQTAATNTDPVTFNASGYKEISPMYRSVKNDEILCQSHGKYPGSAEPVVKLDESQHCDASQSTQTRFDFHTVATNSECPENGSSRHDQPPSLRRVSDSKRLVVKIDKYQNFDDSQTTQTSSHTAVTRSEGPEYGSARHDQPPSQTHVSNAKQHLDVSDRNSSTDSVNTSKNKIDSSVVQSCQPELIFGEKLKSPHPDYGSARHDQTPSKAQTPPSQNCPDMTIHDTGQHSYDKVTSGQHFDKPVPPVSTKPISDQILEMQRLPAVRSFIDKGESCWILPVVVENSRLDFLVDSGATKSLMDTKAFKLCYPGRLTDLHQPEMNMWAANDTAIQIYGEGEIVVEVGQKKFPVMVAVADLGNLDGILGMDFLRRRGLQLDMGEGILKIDGWSVCLHDRQRRVKCSRVTTASEDAWFSPFHEVTSGLTLIDTG